MFFAKNLVVDVVKQMKLKRISISLGRFHSIDNRSTNTVDEIAVEERDCLIQPTHEICFEFLPLFGLHVANGHSTTTSVEYVQIITADVCGIPDDAGVESIDELASANCPVVNSLSVFRLVLTIPASCQVINDPTCPFLLSAGITVAQRKLRFADSGGSHYNRECARNEASSESSVESFVSG
jgi:hypothetical protein